MNTRCKPGDLAFVNDSNKASHIGMVVKTERIDVEGTAQFGEPCWLVTFNGVVVGNNDEVLVGQAICPDRDLTPITGLPIDEEITDQVPA
jgi:hypothetical protein